MVEEAVEDRGGAGNVTQQLAPLFDRAVGGHDRGTLLVAPHDDLEKAFASTWWQGFDPHVVDDEQCGLQVTLEVAVRTGFEIVIFLKFTHEVEDGDIENIVSLLDRGVTERLSEVAFPNSWRTDEQGYHGLP